MRLTSLARACALALVGFSSLSAHAIDVLAIANVNTSLFDASGNPLDYSGLTNTLENGVPAALLGGIGSGLTWAGGNTFLALPDRGPNASDPSVVNSQGWNTSVDNTTSYIPRFQTLTLNLTPSAGGSTPFSLSATLSSTTLLSSSSALSYGSAPVPTGTTSGLNYFTGRSDAFSGTGSTNSNNARLDPEGIRVSNDGTKVYVSDEYGPYVYEFDRATGVRTRSFALPANLAVNTLGPTTASEGKPTNTTGRVANKGMEGLAITPDGKTLVGIMQAPLLQDTKKNVRIVTIDIASGTTHEYAYQLTDGSGVSEIIALNDHQFIVDERDGSGLGDTPNIDQTATAAGVKKLFKIDLTGAQDVSLLSGDLSAKAVAKTQVADLVALLTAAGVDPKLIPSKIEGLAFGQDVTVNGVLKHTLYFANDNDFLNQVADPTKSPTDTTRGLVPNPSKVYVLGVTDAELGGTYSAQNIAAVPEPASWATLAGGLALLGWTVRLKRRG